MRKRSLVLALLILTATAGTAMAVITGDNGNNTLIGTPERDTITAGNGHNTIYGLAGADKITAGNGNDVIDGDGHCTQGTNASYCSHGPIPGDGGDTIIAGNGDDTVFGGGGNNKIMLGTGNNTVYGGPNDDQIAVGLAGGGTDHVYLGSGSNKVAVGKGNNRIYAFHSDDTTNVDYIFCASTATIVYANAQDVVHDCTVVRGPSSGSARHNHHAGNTHS